MTHTTMSVSDVDTKETYSITKLSEQLQITDHTLRFYEKEFQISVPKDQRGRRYYTYELAGLMYKIKCMREVGLEIKAIKKILEIDIVMPMADPTAWMNVSDALKPKELPAGEDNHPMVMALKPNEIEMVISQMKNQIRAEVQPRLAKFEQKMRTHFEDTNKSVIQTTETVEQVLAKNLSLLIEDIESQFLEIKRMLAALESEKEKKWYQKLFGKDDK